MCEHEIERKVAPITSGNSDTEQSFVHTDHLDRDLEKSYQTRERALNAAIVQANISESFEEHLGIFDAFYADDIEVSSETHEEKIRGKASVRALLCDFLIPLHIMAEIGGLQVSIRQIALPGDAAGETHDQRGRLGGDAAYSAQREARAAARALHLADRVEDRSDPVHRRGHCRTCASRTPLQGTHR